MYRFIKIIVFSFLIIPTLAFSQTDNELDKVVTYTKYNPVLTDAHKIENQPELKEPEVQPLKLVYSFPDLRYKVKPAFTPVLAQTFKAQAPAYVQGNFVKVGFGNYTTPLIHLELHNGRNKNYAYGINAYHLSSKGQPAYKSFMDDNVQVHGAKFMNGNTLSGQLGYKRFGYNYYGYDHNENSFKSDSVKQALNTVLGNIHYDNSKTSKKVKTAFDFDMYHFSNKQQSELGYKVANKTGGKIGPGDFYLTTAFEGMASGPDSVKYNRNYIDINPNYKMRYKAVDISLGVFASIFLDSAEITPYLFPEFRLDYYVVPEKMKAYAGISGGLTKGSTRNLFTENPFLAENQPLRNIYTPYNLFIGIKGKLGSGFEYVFEASQRTINNLPLYLTDTNALRKFIIKYDNVGLVKVQAGLNYTKFQKIQIGTNFSYYLYNSSYAHAFQYPDFEWNTTFSSMVSEKLALHGKFYVIGARYSRDIGALESKKLDPIFDLNVGADYRIRKNISLFIDLNNLTNQTYQRWANYKSYGFNGIAGATFSF